MKKAEFRNLLVKALNTKGLDASDAGRINSAIEKTARHARAKYGAADWQAEHDECDVNNAICFYNEYKQENTFNRERYQASRSNGITYGPKGF